MKKQVTFWIEENTRKQFSKLYNSSMSKFFRNCITLALQDKTFFHDVYFMNIFGINVFLKIFLNKNFIIYLLIIIFHIIYILLKVL